MSDGSGALPSKIIVVANEKGGSGKSTVAMNIAIGLMKLGESVATIDLDTRQRSLTHYIDNRLVWARTKGKDIPTPTHRCFDEDNAYLDGRNQDAAAAELHRAIANASADHRYVVVDTAGHHDLLSRSAYAVADTLVTPLNDSFVDLDILASVDPETLRVTGISHYGNTVLEAQRQRRAEGKPPIDWVVLRNRLSMLNSRNKRSVGAAIDELSRELSFRYVDGLAERLIFREFYPRGLTAFDDLKERTLGMRPTMSHVTAQLEVQSLLRALLRQSADSPAVEAEQRHVA